MKAEKITVPIPDLGAIDAAAEEFLRHLDRPVVAFHGEMGAGKTTFISALCRLWGVREAVASPSFAIVNEYRKADGEPVYHFDFYRLDNLQEALDLGAEDYFWSGHPCLVEWPDLVDSLLPPEKTLDVYLQEDPLTGVRSLSFLK